MKSILQLVLAAAILTEVSAVPPWDHSAYRPPWWKPRPSKSLTKPGWPGWPSRPTPTKSPVVVIPSVKPTTPVVPGPASSSSVAASHAHPHPQPTGPVTPRPTGDGPIPPGFKFEPRLTEETKLTPGSRLVTLRTGPYRVKPGEMFSTFDPSIKKPCDNCWITAGEGRIEYEDGTEANIDTGAYLHHMVVASLGAGGGGPPPGVVTGNSTGGPPPGVGGGGIGGPPGLSCDPDSIIDVKAGLGFGNERTVTRFNGDGTLKFGSPIGPSDRFSLILDMMNDGDEDKIIYARVVYEIVEGEYAKGFVQSKSFKLDVGACGSSEVPAEMHGQYSQKSPVFTSSISGTLLYTTGHMHDGGVNITVFKNDEPICVSDMLYDRRAGWREPADSPNVNAKHISDAGVCTNFGRIEVGDKFHIVSYYDADKYPPTAHKGDEHLHPVMGIAFVFVGPDTPSSTAPPTTISSIKPPVIIPSSSAPAATTVPVVPTRIPTPAPTVPGDGHDHEH